MHRRHLARLFALLVLGLVVFQWALAAQTPAGQKPAAQKPAAQKPATQAPAEKRPLPYDVVDYWRSIQGTRLSNDGQWLAYATTSQAEDGELVVRNVKTGQEFKHPRGTGPTFSSDNAFVVFTIARSKADEEKERQAAQGTETPAGGQGTRGEGAAAATPREPPTGLGIMALPGGKVTTVDKVGSFRMAEESATWLAYYKGVGGAGGGGGARGAGGGARGAGGGARGATPPAAAGAQTAQRSGRGAPREKRKDPGSNLILRKLATAEETTIPEVSEYTIDTKGIWLAYATSSADAAKDGAFARSLADGTVKTLATGRGHYKSLTFNEAGSQIAFLSDQAEYDKPVSPVPPLPLEGRRRTRGRTRLLLDARRPQGPRGL